MFVPLAYLLSTANDRVWYNGKQDKYSKMEIIPVSKNQSTIIYCTTTKINYILYCINKFYISSMSIIRKQYKCDSK